MRERHPKGHTWNGKPSRALTPPAVRDDFALPDDWCDPWGHDTGRAVDHATDADGEWHTNADRMDDVESHKPMSDGRATYLDNEG